MALLIQNVTHKLINQLSHEAITLLHVAGWGDNPGLVWWSVWLVHSPEWHSAHCVVIATHPTHSTTAELCLSTLMKLFYLEGKFFDSFYICIYD